MTLKPDPEQHFFFLISYYEFSFNKRLHHLYSAGGDVWHLWAYSSAFPARYRSPKWQDTFSILYGIEVWYFSPGRISSCLSDCKHWSESVSPDTRDLDVCCPQRLHRRHTVANGFWAWKEIKIHGRAEESCRVEIIILCGFVSLSLSLTPDDVKTFTGCSFPGMIQMFWAFH